VNFLETLLKYIALVPAVVKGTEVIIQGEKQGATKKAMAMQSLALASGIASYIAPEFAPLITTIENIGSALIDGVVTGLNQDGTFSTATPQTTTATPKTATAPTSRFVMGSIK